MTNSKKRIVILLGCLAMLFIMIIGISYAYYAANVKGNTSSNPSLKLTSGYLSIVYDGGDSKISGGSTSGTTDDLVYTKTFTVTNDGVADAYYGVRIKNYEVYTLDDSGNKVASSFSRPIDWTYELKSGDVVISSGQFPTNDEPLISTRKLALGTSENLVLTVTYNYITEEEGSIDQSADMNKLLSFDITVTQSMNILDSTTEGTLLYAINRDNEITDPITVPGRASSTAEEAVLASTEDDYGTSYYFRGAVKNNYVNYSGMCWRIVRVQGDGTIKLVLADEKGLCNADTYSVNNETTAFINDNEMYAYSYDYSETGATYASGDIPGELSTWMTSKITDTSDLVTTEWCNDMSILSTPSYGFDGNENYDESLTDYTDVYYGAYRRLGNTTTASPSLKCNMKGLNNSQAIRYESNIGILTADEIAFAGGVSSTENSTYYLSTNANSRSYWTMTPYFYEDYQEASKVYGVHLAGQLTRNDVFEDYAIRPAVVLQSNVTIKDGGVGTQTNPYVIAD